MRDVAQTRTWLSVLWLAVATVPSGPAYAESFAHSAQAWAGAFFQGPLRGDLFFQGDLHYRVSDQGAPATAIVRPAIGWLLAPGVTVTLGYAYTPSWPAPGVKAVGEHRAWQQAQIDQPVLNGALRVQWRSRLEQRSRPATSEAVGLRFRQFVRWTRPLGERWLLTAWDEVFVGLNRTDWGQLLGFDQNRVFIGIGAHVVPMTFRVEAGYFNLARRTPPGKADGMIHAAMVNLFVNW
ncbi:MAG: DUF2490 domain-containing protein [Deltaproteobacteria bacterium]|nr:DUF2490 domain-containing protein [Deltaproteobacteria bacterium]